ncbi:MAG: hypothetical protein KC912_25955 [Proteobacteria bacterium]|nr:hypothetical protein [Pseudomonadota bacterium]
MTALTRLAILTLLVACGPRETATNPNQDENPNTDSGVDSADTDTAPVLKTVDEVRFRAFVAWDAEQQAIVDPIIEGGNFISAYTITIYQTGWDADDESTYCTIMLNLNGYAISETAADEGYLWGLDLPQGTKGISEDCIAKGWDPAEFEGDPIADWGARDWHLRLGGNPNATLTEWLTPNDPDPDFDINRFTGGTWWTDNGGLSGGDESVYWYGYELDSTHAVNYDVEIHRDDLTNDSGGLRTGYYLFRMSSYWNFAQ